MNNKIYYYSGDYFNNVFKRNTRQMKNERCALKCQLLTGTRKLKSLYSGQRCVNSLSILAAKTVINGNIL